MSYHVPVLAQAAVDLLVVDPAGVFADCTFGGGGHARLILGRLGPSGRLLAFDQDPDAAREAAAIDDARLTFVAANFRHLRRYARLYAPEGFSGVFADLGVSSHQFDVPERGFSFRYDAPLDMRMSQDEATPTAARLLARADAAELQGVLGEYGEVRNARTVARAIVEQRAQRPLRTTGDLVAALEPHVRGERHRYLAQVFQALRIAVNDEYGALEELLAAAEATTQPGGRLVVLSYHSGEDRLVKNVMRSGRPDGRHQRDDFGHIARPWAVETKKPIEAPAAETLHNSRARSARLRAATRSDETAAKH